MHQSSYYNHDWTAQKNTGHRTNGKDKNPVIPIRGPYIDCPTETPRAKQQVTSQTVMPNRQKKIQPVAFANIVDGKGV